MIEETDEGIDTVDEAEMAPVEAEAETVEVVEEVAPVARKKEPMAYTPPPEPPKVKHLRTRADVKMHNRLKQAMAKRKK